LIISLLQISVTAASILSGMISLRWANEEKGVDMRLVVKAIEDRQASYNQKQALALAALEAKSPTSLVSKSHSLKSGTTSPPKLLIEEEEASSDDTENSDQQSNVDVAAELEMFTRDDPKFNNVPASEVKEQVTESQGDIEKSNIDLNQTSEMLLPKQDTFESVSKG
jgi:hypothetical protein